jgi:hypothetical protein
LLENNGARHFEAVIDRLGGELGLGLWMTALALHFTSRSGSEDCVYRTVGNSSIQEPAVGPCGLLKPKPARFRSKTVNTIKIHADVPMFK